MELFLSFGVGPQAVPVAAHLKFWKSAVNHTLVDVC